jgi:hypothetical protein
MTMPTMIPRIGQRPTLTVDATRRRETPRPTGFQEVLRKSGQLLLAGAQVAGHLVGGPMLSAAVARLRTGADSLGSTAAATSTGTSGTSTVDSLRAMQSERMSEELQLIALQSDVQRQDRQVTLTSNLLKAQHDTAKQAISNIRS